LLLLTGLEGLRRKVARTVAVEKVVMMEMIFRKR
jgi:hypothetical protein